VSGDERPSDVDVLRCETLEANAKLAEQQAGLIRREGLPAQRDELFGKLERKVHVLQ
jgi:hypothetical protein